MLCECSHRFIVNCPRGLARRLQRRRHSRLGRLRSVETLVWNDSGAGMAADVPVSMAYRTASWTASTTTIGEPISVRLFRADFKLPRHNGTAKRAVLLALIKLLIFWWGSVLRMAASGCCFCQGTEWSFPVTRGRLLISSLLLIAWFMAVPEASAINVWVTAGDKSKLLSQQTDILFQPGTGSGGTPISVVPTTTYQTISGFARSP